MLWLSHYHLTCCRDEALNTGDYVYLVGYGLLFGALILATMHGAQWIAKWTEGPPNSLDNA